MKDDELTSLDVSLNCLDFRSMLILEDSLERHKHLKQLDISNNVLGSLGMRSALRLLAVPTSGLVSFDASNSYGGSAARAQTFNRSNPGGTLDIFSSSWVIFSL